MIPREKISVRRVAEADLPQMTAARIDYLTEMQGERAESYKEDLREKLVDFFRQRMLEGSFFALLAEYEGQVVGYGAMVLKKIPGDFHQATYLEGDILNMYTLPAFRRNGISSLILEQLLSEAGKLGVSKVALHCSRSGEPLYRKYGFADPAYPYLELIIN